MSRLWHGLEVFAIALQAVGSFVTAVATISYVKGRSDFRSPMQDEEPLGFAGSEFYDEKLVEEEMKRRERLYEDVE